MIPRDFVNRSFHYLGRCWKGWTNPEKRALKQLKRSIGHLPRRQPGQIRIWGWDLEFVDAASCVSAFDWIVSRKILDFDSQSLRPRILDCGANIGISVLHFKRMFPEAEITAFEPDPKICEILRRNLRANNARDVRVVEAALWDAEGEMAFVPDGADGGQLGDIVGSGKGKLVQTQLLSKYLKEPVDLVKMDIEGAEGRVIKEAASELENVANIILEYHIVSEKPQDLDELLRVLFEGGFRYHINSVGEWLSLIDTPASSGLPFEQLLMISAKRYQKRDS